VSVRRAGAADAAAIAALLAELGYEAAPADVERGLGALERSEALVAELDEGFASLSYEEVAQRLNDGDVTWGPYQTPREVVQDPQAQAAGCFVQTPDGEGATFPAPAGPARFPGADDGPKGPAPRLGQHTAEVLVELGYSAAEIEAMKAAGAAA